MSHASVVMVRCPTTGRELSRGVEMDASTFERLPDIRSELKMSRMQSCEARSANCNRFYRPAVSRPASMSRSGF